MGNTLARGAHVNRCHQHQGHAAQGWDRSFSPQAPGLPQKWVSPCARGQRPAPRVRVPTGPHRPPPQGTTRGTAARRPTAWSCPVRAWSPAVRGAPCRAWSPFYAWSIVTAPSADAPCCAGSAARAQVSVEVRPCQVRSVCQLLPLAPPPPGVPAKQQAAAGSNADPMS